MRTTAISALVVAGAVSAASAQPPSKPVKNETAQRVSYTAETPRASPASGWVELASATPAKHGRVFVTLDGRYAQLRIDAQRGQPLVQSIRINYADGTQRVVKIGRKLEGKNASALIEAHPGRAIDHIVILTNTRSQGTYTVSGAPAQATGVATR